MSQDDDCPITERVPVSPRTGWRKIQATDVERGTVVRLKNLVGCYNIATIIGVHNQEGWKHVSVARPMARACEHYNDKQPTLYCEVFDIGMDSLLGDSSDVEVYQERNSVHRMTA